MQEIKNTVTEIFKNSFSRFIRRLDMSVDRTSKLEDMSIETAKTEKEWPEFPKFDKRWQFIHLRSSLSPKQDKHLKKHN